MSLERGRILGIGGIFFKSDEADLLRQWYHDKLGLKNEAHGTMFKWRSVDEPEREDLTVWSIFPSASKYFEPSNQSFMINYIVDDIDAFLGKLEAAGVTIDPKRDDFEYGRFAWIYDPDGNKIELWEPVPPLP